MINTYIVLGISFITNYVLGAQTFVKYAIPLTKEFTTFCAVQGLSNENAGVTVVDGDCSVISSQSPDLLDPNMARKKTTISTYKDTHFEELAFLTTDWFFPGFFFAGSKLKVIFKLPVELKWKRYCLSVRQLKPSKIGLARVCFYHERQRIEYTQNDGIEWTFRGDRGEIFEAGKIYSIEFRAQRTHVLIYVDDVFQIELENIAPPQTMKRFRVDYGYMHQRPHPEIMKLIFQGL